MQEKVQLGKYQVSPIIHQLHDGSYSASVSIHAGKGNACIDRIVRFVKCFTTEQAAQTYAISEGVGWVNDPNKYQRGW